MFLLVNLEGHQHEMGEIISGLVQKYSVPISIVDSCEKLCPNCGNQPNASKNLDDKDSGLLEPQEPIDVKPNVLLDNMNSSPPNMGRRTAAKHSAVMRAMEKRPEELKEMKPFNGIDVMDLMDGHGPSSSAEPSRSDSHTPTTDAVTSSGMQTPGEDSTAEGDESAPLLESVADFANQNFESMHPTLLACLISNTPNVFAQDGRSSPLSDSGASSAMKFDPTDYISSNNSRVLGQLGFPVTSSGKVRRGRIVYNSRDLDVLESFYKQDPNACADPMKKKQMMDILGVDAVRLKVWFQNRRRKDKIKWLKDHS